MYIELTLNKLIVITSLQSMALGVSTLYFILFILNKYIMKIFPASEDLTKYCIQY